MLICDVVNSGICPEWTHEVYIKQKSWSRGNFPKRKQEEEQLVMK
jgi:hypothetical protein